MEVCSTADVDCGGRQDNAAACGSDRCLANEHRILPRDQITLSMAGKVFDVGSEFKIAFAVALDSAISGSDEIIEPRNRDSSRIGKSDNSANVLNRRQHFTCA